jgi:molybdopterin/thiamine biosynthesis adenylyltransferase
MSMTPDQLERYARHLMLPEIGVAGQEKLLASRVLVVGVGGLGSPAAFYLAAAGVGTLGLMDGDTVALSNLQRQILHDTPGIGRMKVASGAEKLERLNPDVTLRQFPFRFTPENAA